MGELQVGLSKPGMEERESESNTTCLGFCLEGNIEYVFDNIWFLYLAFVIFLLLIPCLIYAVSTKCCYPDKFPAVKWHIIIFIINSSLWYLLARRQVLPWFPESVLHFGVHGDGEGGLAQYQGEREEFVQGADAEKLKAKPSNKEDDSDGSSLLSYRQFLG